MASKFSADLGLSDVLNQLRTLRTELESVSTVVGRVNSQKAAGGGSRSGLVTSNVDQAHDQRLIVPDSPGQARSAADRQYEVGSPNRTRAPNYGQMFNPADIQRAKSTNLDGLSGLIQRSQASQDPMAIFYGQQASAAQRQQASAAASVSRAEGMLKTANASGDDDARRIAAAKYAKATERFVRATEQASSEMENLSSALGGSGSGGGGGGGVRGAVNRFVESLGGYQRIIAGVASAAGIAGAVTGMYGQANVMASQAAPGALSGVGQLSQGLFQQRASNFNFTGRSLVENFGDILYAGDRRSQYLGVSGLGRASADADRLVRQQMRGEKQEAIGGLLARGVGSIAGGVGIAAFGGFNPLSMAAGAGVAATGLFGATRDFLGSAFGRESFGGGAALLPGMGNAADSIRGEALVRRQQLQRQRQIDLRSASADMFASETVGLQSATEAILGQFADTSIAGRFSRSGLEGLPQLGSTSIYGARVSDAEARRANAPATISTRVGGGRYGVQQLANPGLGIMDAEISTGRAGLAAAEERNRQTLAGNSYFNTVSSLGMNFRDFASVQNRLTSQMGATGEASTADTARLIRLSRTGAGSTDSLLGQSARLTELTGQASSVNMLADVLSKAVASGFDKSISLQKFASATVSLAERSGATGTSGFAGALSAISTGMGGNLRSLNDAAAGLARAESFTSQSSGNVGALKAFGLLSAGVGIGEGAGILSGLSAGRLSDIRDQISSGNVTDPEARQLVAMRGKEGALGAVSGVLRGTSGAVNSQLELTLGRGIDRAGLSSALSNLSQARKGGNQRAISRAQETFDRLAGPIRDAGAGTDLGANGALAAVLQDINSTNPFKTNGRSINSLIGETPAEVENRSRFMNSLTAGGASTLNQRADDASLSNFFTNGGKLEFAGKSFASLDEVKKAGVLDDVKRQVSNRQLASSLQSADKLGEQTFTVIDGISVTGQNGLEEAFARALGRVEGNSIRTAGSR